MCTRPPYELVGILSGLYTEQAVIFIYIPWSSDHEGQISPCVGIVLIKATGQEAQPLPNAHAVLRDALAIKTGGLKSGHCT